MKANIHCNNKEAGDSPETLEKDEDLFTRLQQGSQNVLL